MGEDLKRLNEGFKNFLIKLKSKKEISKETEALLYLAYISGFNENSGATQMIS